VQSTLSSRRILYKTKPKPSQETRKTKAIKPSGWVVAVAPRDNVETSQQRISWFSHR
jgi:hypothetical protein